MHKQKVMQRQAKSYRKVAKRQAKSYSEYIYK